MRVVKRYGLLVCAVVLFCGQVSGGLLGMKNKTKPKEPKAKDQQNGVVHDEKSGADVYCGNGEITRALYVSVRDLLLYKIDTWSKDDGRNLESISRYLGFPPVTRNLLDFAVTELMHVERTGKINVPDLMDLFFYACDVENMRDYGPGEQDAVADRFKEMLSRFPKPELVLNWEGRGLEYFQKELMKNVRKAVANKQWSDAFTVSVPLLKNRMFTDVQSASETVRKLQRRFIGEHAGHRETETDGKAVVAYHVSVLEKIVPDVFAFAYDHVLLMSDLLLRPGTGYNKDLLAVAGSFSGFVKQYKETLVDRYFEMKTGMDEEYKSLFRRFQDDLTSLTDRLNPIKNPWTNTRKYAEKQAYVDDVKGYMKGRLAAMLTLFGSESVGDWDENRTIIVEYSAVVDSDARLLTLLKNNVTEANDFLSIIRKLHVDPIPSQREESRSTGPDNQYWWSDVPYVVRCPVV